MFVVSCTFVNCKNCNFSAIIILMLLTEGGRTGSEAHRDHRPTVRGLASRLKSADSIDRDAASTGSTDSEECHVYSNRVDEVFKSLPHMLFASPTASASSPDGLC